MTGSPSQEKRGAVSREPRGVLRLVRPAGFCPGVRQALALCRSLLGESPGRPLYVLRDLVHNRQVSRQLQQEGVVFAEAVEQVPRGERLLLGAHGTTRATLDQCRQRQLEVHDATCPVIRRLQAQLRELPRTATVCLLGEAAHPEIQALRDCLPEIPCHLVSGPQEAEALPPLPPDTFFFCQTSRGEAEVEQVRRILRQKGPRLQDRARICPAQSTRQKALAALAPLCDRVYILGSSHSANGRRLLQLAREGCPGPCRMLEEGESLSPEELAEVACLGVASAASTPDALVEACVAHLRRLGFSLAEEEEEEGRAPGRAPLPPEGLPPSDP